MNERFSVILMLLLSFTEQVKAIYCFSALVCVFIVTRLRSYEGSFAAFFPPSPLLWPSIFCAPFTFPVISSPVSGFAWISSLRKANFGKRVGLRETRWVLPPQLLCAAARCSSGLSRTAWCCQRCTRFCLFTRVCPSPKRTCTMQKNCLLDQDVFFFDQIQTT